MRCNNCGWENPAGNQKCEKCNAPLSGSMISGNDTPRRRYSSVGEELKGTLPEAGKGPDAGNREKPDPVERGMGGKSAACPQCGYPVSPAMSACPNCGYMLGVASRDVREAAQPADRGMAQPDRNAPGGPKGGKICPQCGGAVSLGAKFCPSCGASLRMGTVSSWDAPQQGTFCTLKPLPWKGEEVTYQPVSYSGTVVSLNRSNTDSNNNTITSKEQAVLVHESDGWYIEDRSELHTTFVRADKRRKLESGDVIALGNRLFEFKD